MLESLRRHLPAIGLLTALLLALFYRSFDPALTLSVGDGSLATIKCMYRIGSALFAGSWSAWDGMGGGGTPTNIAPGFFLIHVVPFVKYGDAVALFHLFLMGIGGYFLLHDMTRSRFAAYLGGLFLMLQPHVLSHLLPGHVGHFIMAGWVPLLFCFTRRAVLTGGLVNWTMAGACMGALVAAGQHDVSAFFGITLAAYGLFLLIRSRADRTTLRQWSATLGGIVLAGVLVLLMSYQALFANMLKQVTADKTATALGDANGQSMSAQEKWLWATQWSVPPEEVADMAIPGFFGWGSSTGDNPYRGRIGQTEGWMTHHQGLPNLNDVCQYLGAMLLLGMLMALALRWRDPEMWFFFVASLVSLLLAFGKFAPFYQLFYSIPGVDTLRNPIKWFYITSLGAGIMGVLGLAEVARADAPPVSRLKAVLLAFLPAIAVLAGGALLLARLENSAFPFWQQKELLALSGQAIGWAALFWGAGGLALLLMLTGRKAKRQWSRRAGMTLAALTMTTELFYVNSHYMPYHEWAPELNAGPFTPFLKSVQMPSRFRFLGQDGLSRQMRNVAHMQGMEFADPYPARLPDEFLLLQRHIEQKDPLKFWRLCNVRYVVAPGLLKDPAFQLVLSLKAGNSTMMVHEMKSTLPRCFRVSAWRPAPEKEAAELILDPRFDPGQEALIHAPALELPPLPTGQTTQAVCRILSYSSTQTRVETESDQPGVLVFLTRYHPDWTARVDGKPVSHWKADGIMQACPVPAGRHVVTWDYEQPGARRSLYVALTGWALALLLTLVGLLVHVRHTRTARA